MNSHYLALAALLVVCVAQLAQPANGVSKQQQDWHNNGRDQLLKNKREFDNVKKLAKAKNVILFLGDGMGISTLTAARSLKSEKRKVLPGPDRLFFEEFPNLGLSMTYNMDKMAPDSAGSATAYLCGVKANLGVLSLDERVQLGDCKAYIDNPDTKIKCVSESLSLAGKSVGLATTKPITDASPTPMYASSPDRDWQSSNDTSSNENAATHGCKDIASQLVDSGIYLNVALGGGADRFMASSRSDGRDLPTEWLEAKRKQGRKPATVFSGTELSELDTTDVTDLLGLFAESGMKYDLDRESSESDEPSLTQMAEKALEIVSKNPNGYFLFIEGGNIDKAHHDAVAHQSLEDTLAFEKAVETIVKKVNLEETLVIVTADHSHVFTYGTSASRSNSIFDFTDYSNDLDGKPYNSLVYANGPGFKVTNTGKRPDLKQEDTHNPNYLFEAAVHLGWETHSCEEVAIYATGPQSHLINNLVEQTTVAHLMLYATCTEQYADAEHCVTKPEPEPEPDDDASSIVRLHWAMLLLTVLPILKLII